MREDKLSPISTYDGNQLVKKIVLLEKHIDLTKIPVHVLALAEQLFQNSTVLGALFNWNINSLHGWNI